MAGAQLFHRYEVTTGGLRRSSSALSSDARCRTPSGLPPFSLDAAPPGQGCAGQCFCPGAPTYPAEGHHLHSILKQEWCVWAHLPEEHPGRAKRPQAHVCPVTLPQTALKASPMGTQRSSQPAASRLRTWEALPVPSGNMGSGGPLSFSRCLSAGHATPETQMNSELSPSEAHTDTLPLLRANSPEFEPSTES